MTLSAFMLHFSEGHGVIAKLMRLPRKAAERTRQADWRRIGSLLGQFSPQECENPVRSAGYGSVQTPHALAAEH